MGYGFAEVAALISLAMAALLAAALEPIKLKRIRVVVGSIAAASILASAVLFGALAQRPAQGEDLSAPALVVAQADAESVTRTLVISFDPELSVDYVWGDGRSADERSVLYSYIGARSDLKQNLADLTAQLVAANPEVVGGLLEELGIDFVLVNGETAQALSAKAAVSGMEFFQVAGESEFGSLFRVTTAVSQPKTEITWLYSDWQLAILGLFALLAIPTPATIRGYRRKVSK
jgi:hypothetical protein